METDSPVLGIDRNSRNEPQFVQTSAEFIAKIKKLPLEEVIRVTTKNAKKLFKIP